MVEQTTQALPNYFWVYRDCYLAIFIAIVDLENNIIKLSNEIL